jgi:hypothetical protein
MLHDTLLGARDRPCLSRLADMGYRMCLTDYGTQIHAVHYCSEVGPSQASRHRGHADLLGAGATFLVELYGAGGVEGARGLLTPAASGQRSNINSMKYALSLRTRTNPGVPSDEPCNFGFMSCAGLDNSVKKWYCVFFCSQGQIRILTVFGINPLQAILPYSAKRRDAQVG